MTTTVPDGTPVPTRPRPGDRPAADTASANLPDAAITPATASAPTAPDATASGPAPDAAPTTVLVCVNCRADGEAADAERAGRRLHDALAAAAADRPGIRVVGVECLSVCRRPVTIGFAGAAKWTYLYGDFAPEAAEAILATADLYAAAPDGLIPWKSRPDAFKKGVVARIPALALAQTEIAR